MLFGSDTSKAAEVDQLFREIRICIDRYYSVYHPIEVDAYISKLLRLLKRYPSRVLTLCNQKSWAEFILFLNAMLGGYSRNLVTMEKIIEAMTDESSLITVATSGAYGDTVCVFAINAVKTQATLLEIFKFYDEQLPLDYFNWGDSFAAPDFRGGESIYTILRRLDDEHLLIGLRSLRKQPCWAEERVIERFKYGLVWTNRDAWNKLIRTTKSKRALKSFEHRRIKYEEVIILYHERLDKMESMGLLTKDEKLLYR